MIRTALALALLATPALAQQSIAPTAAGRLLTQGVDAMHRDIAAAPRTGDPDRDFIATLLPTDQGGIDLAEVELRYGTEPGIIRLARDIVAAREKEIAAIRAWQAKHPQ